MRPLVVVSAAAMLAFTHASSPGQIGVSQPKPRATRSAPPAATHRPAAAAPQPLLPAFKPFVPQRLSDPMPRIAVATLGPITATTDNDQANRASIASNMDQQIAVTGWTLVSPPSPPWEAVSAQQLLGPVAGLPPDLGAGPGAAPRAAHLDAWPTSASAASLMAVMTPAAR